MNLDPAELKQALADAHLPSLMMALVHLTGDAGHLDGVKPVYDFFGDGQGGIAPEKQAQIRELAERVITEFIEGRRPLPPPPDQPTIRRMMDFISGSEIPERYVPFLMEELAVDGIDRKRPVWAEAKLAGAAQRPEAPA